MSDLQLSQESQEKRRLSHKRRVFVDEYIKTWNATEAARRAGYAHPNKQGPRLLVKVGIREEIVCRLEENGMLAAEVLYRLAEQARNEFAGYILPDGSYDLERCIADGRSHLIKSVKITQFGLCVEPYDSQDALVLIGRFYGLFSDRIVHDVSDRAVGIVGGLLHMAGIVYESEVENEREKLETS